MHYPPGMSTPVKPPYSVRQVFVCTNVRDPQWGKPSCGRNGAIELRERLKKTVKERGLKRQVLVTQSGCLDHCPQTGCTVAIYPENEWAVVECTPEEEEALLARILEGTTPPT